jgi:hypothetical protein
MSKIAFHWLVVGFISDGAKAWIEEVGGKVVTLHHDPTLIGVALAYNPDGVWTWSRGRQEYRNGIEYWSTGELQEASTGITLDYGNIDHGTAEYCSAETNYLILPDEQFDRTTRTAKRLDPVEDAGSQFPADDEDLLGDLDDFPF